MQHVSFVWQMYISTTDIVDSGVYYAPKHVVYVFPLASASAT